MREENETPERGNQPDTAEPGTPASGFPEPPGRNPGDRSDDPEAHHALNSPAEDPDETEYPDPYDKREDPAAPAEGQTFGEEDPHRPIGSESTSDPHPSQDPQEPDWEGPKRDKVDE